MAAGEPLRLERDPRTDPQPGDALRPIAGRVVRYIVQRKPDRVLVHWGGFGNWMRLSTWRTWASQPMESVTFETAPLLQTIRM
jgi:hypothetical protein